MNPNMPEHFQRPSSPVMLAIDTATSCCSVAVGNSTGRILTRSEITDRRHNQALPMIVDELLASGGYKWRDLSAIIVSIGPGSFTGLRVGVSFAKGAALALGLPLVPVSTLLLLAETFGISCENGTKLLPLIPARKGESFGQIFRKTDNGIVCESEPMLVDQGLAAELIEKGCILVGEGARQFVEAIKYQNDNVILFTEVFPSPEVLLRLGEALLNSDTTFPITSNIEPVYLKEFTVKFRK